MGQVYTKSSQKALNHPSPHQQTKYPYQQPFVRAKLWYNIALQGVTMLKDVLYTGIGAATLFKEHVEAELKKLEERGKLGASDAKSVLAALEARGKEEDEKAKARIKTLLKEVIEELGIATKADLEALKKELK